MAEEVLWERDLHQRGSGSALAVADGCVVVHERWTRLVCLDLSDGSVRWDVPFGLWPRAVAVTGDRCFGIAQNIDALTCWDVRSGAVLWNLPLSRFTGYITATEDTVLIGGWRGYTDLTALDSETGRLRWSRSGRPATVRPFAHCGGVLIGAPGSSEMSLLDVHDGSERGHWTLPEPLWSADHARIFALGGPGRVLVQSGRRTVVELRLGTDEIRTLARHDSDLTPAGARLVGGLLWLTDAKGGTAYDAADGHLLWRVDIGQWLAPGIVPAGPELLIGGDQGTLLRLDHDGRTVRRTSVSRRIAGVHAAGPVEAPDVALVVTRGTLMAIRIGE
ncbi:outer membrane protein assembly factor BamB family protein [Streptacidiphilus rugosus]|uniref:outer membrane protein assembly factor BamB family protein n=1 Tax=Streptacidiphilus rugosus TaxID=405783 RepID=UPI000565F87E|nr:PQQ-binding-like beta-propeller repeat protein [Streptacidiphilus rugosus]